MSVKREKMHRYLWSIQIKYLSLHLKNHQNFKGLMINGHSLDSNTLRQRIEAMPEDSILFRSASPWTNQQRNVTFTH